MKVTPSAQHSAPSTQHFLLTVNGVKRRLEADAERSLLDVLRNDLELTGAKYGCGEGQCGACTVLVDGKAVRSCITSIASVNSKAVTTIEGIGGNGRLHPVQEAFIEENAMQCGYCIPGMIMSAVGLLGRSPRPSTEDILHSMEGNICRCAAYPRIVAAITRASKNGGKS
jgi:aerobic-type carbon monoxide dehydrogenase small subunit (CoxS/CutS family)